MPVTREIFYRIFCLNDVGKSSSGQIISGLIPVIGNRFDTEEEAEDYISMYLKDNTEYIILKICLLPNKNLYN